FCFDPVSAWIGLKYKRGQQLIWKTLLPQVPVALSAIREGALHHFAFAVGKLQPEEFLAGRDRFLGDVRFGGEAVRRKKREGENRFEPGEHSTTVESRDGDSIKLRRGAKVLTSRLGAESPHFAHTCRQISLKFLPRRWSNIPPRPPFF